MLKAGFSRFLSARPERLHFAAHSHHPWPDVSYEAHNQAWLDAATLADDKWAKIFGELIPATQGMLAGLLDLSDRTTITFSPNTHDFLSRIFSCMSPPARVLSTDAEFHSFRRQSTRWEEAGLAIVERVAAQPFETFPERFTAALRSGGHDLIYLSHVFFDSGYLVQGLDRIVSAVSDQNAFIVIDGYHSFMAMPVELGAIQDRVFFLAGGYKYAMSGEGVCFLHCPPGYGPRPVNTGWYAGFGQLESGPGDEVGYSVDGSRFSGATFDPSGIYRMEAVLRWLAEAGVTPAVISDHVYRLQRLFLETSPMPGRLLPPEDLQRGNFLTFETPHAADLYRKLHGSNVITDYRRDRLRIGFGIYHDSEDVERLVSAISRVL